RRHRWHRPGSGATTAAKHGTKASEASGGDGTLWKTNRPTRGFLTSGAVHAARDHAVISAHRTAAEKGSLPLEAVNTIRGFSRSRIGQRLENSVSRNSGREGTCGFSKKVTVRGGAPVAASTRSSIPPRVAGRMVDAVPCLGPLRPQAFDQGRVRGRLEPCPPGL